jgi:glutamyl-tRNA synthetase
VRIRTRFAPSPTGDLHLGNARTAVLNWLFARHAGGEFIVRFEDTDRARNVAVAEQGILETLSWLGLDPDEDPVHGGPFGPYRQSERLPIYKAYAEQLLREGKAYFCYATPEELAGLQARSGHAPARDRPGGRCGHAGCGMDCQFRVEGREPAVRFRVDLGPVTFTDLIKGEITIDGSDFGDMVILRPDGIPTYNFAVVVDDHLMEISHVIRGVGHVANTPKQLLLYDALGIEPPAFAHIPTVLAPGGGKLSKREGAAAVLDYRDAGFLADAVLNYLSLLSWSSPSGEEIRTRQQLVEEADLGRVGVADVTLDPEKMRWVSGQHIRMESHEALAARLAEFPPIADLNLNGEELAATARIMHDRIHLLAEAASEIEELFSDASTTPEATAVLSDPDAARVVDGVHDAWSEIEDWQPPVIRQVLRDAGTRLGVKGKALFQPVRAALTGRLKGPEIPDVAYVLGKGRTLERLARATPD